MLQVVVTFVPTSTMTKTFRRKLAENVTLEAPGNCWRRWEGWMKVASFLASSSSNLFLGGPKTKSWVEVWREWMFFFSKRGVTSFLFPWGVPFSIFYESGRKSKPAWRLLETLKKDVKIHLGSQSVPSTKGLQQFAEAISGAKKTSQRHWWVVRWCCGWQVSSCTSWCSTWRMSSQDL